MAAVLIVLAYVHGLLLRETGGIPVIRPGQGLLLGVLLTSANAARIRYCLIGLLALAVGNAASGADLVDCTLFAAVTVMDVLIAYALVRRFHGSELDLLDPMSLFRFVALAAVVMPLIATACYAVLPALVSTVRTPGNQFAFLLSNSLGVVLMFPLIWLYKFQPIAEFARGDALRRLGLSLVITVLMTFLVFDQSRYPLLFMAIPPLVVSVFLAGLAGGALSLTIMVTSAILFTVIGSGPTMLIHAAASADRIVVVQIFCCMAAAVVLLLAAVLGQRDRAQELLEQTQARLLDLATTDKLTGLANRHRFDDVLASECLRAVRSGDPLSLLLLDVDHFKAFNDSYGHQAGDECLQALAGAIMASCHRPADLCARYGGEELVIVLPGTDEAGAITVARELLAAISQLAIPHALNGKCGPYVSASIGVATAAPQALAYEPALLIQQADKHLYEAKRLGRNRTISASTMPDNPVAPIVPSEVRRVAAVEAYRRHSGEQRSPELDWIAHIAATMLGSPIGLVSLVGRDDQIFVGRYGLDVEGTNRDDSFCAHTIASELPLVVPNATEDRRFVDNALVTGELNIRFYAGAPLANAEGTDPLGALCVIDRVPHPTLTPEQRKQLSNLAALAAQIIESTIGDRTKLAA